MVFAQSDELMLPLLPGRGIARDNIITQATITASYLLPRRLCRTLHTTTNCPGRSCDPKQW